MKPEQDAFDKIVREKLDSRSFEPGPGSWEKAEKLIDDQRSKRRGPLAWLLLFLVAGAVFAAYYFAGTSSGDAGKKTTAQAENSSTSHSTENPGNPTNRATEQSSSATITPDQAEENTSVPGSSSTTSAGNSSASSSNSSQPATQGQNSSMSGAAQPEGGSSSSSASGGKNGKAGKNKQPKQTSSAGSGKPGSHPKEKGNNAGHPAASVQGEASAETYSAEHSYSSGMNHADSAHPNIDTTKNSVAAHLPVPASPVKTIFTENQLDTSMKRLHPEHRSPGDDESKTKTNAIPRWFAEAGFTFLPGYSGMDRSLNPVAGGGIMIPLGEHFGISAGLDYTFLNHASDSSIIYDSTLYSFGVENHRTEIGLRRLHYIGMPVNFYWRMNDHHAFFAGGSFQYLLATESRVRSYTESYSTIRDEKISSVFGYDAGIRNFDLLLDAGYMHTFGPHWSLQASYYYGLMDIKDDARYGVRKFERNSGLRFTLLYSF